MVLVLVVEDSSFHDCDCWILAKLYYRWVVFKHAALIRKIAHRTLVRCGARCRGLVGNLAGIYIVLCDGIGSGIDPSLGHVKFSIAIGVASWASNYCN